MQHDIKDQRCDSQCTNTVRKMDAGWVRNSWRGNESTAKKIHISLDTHSEDKKKIQRGKNPGTVPSLVIFCFLLLRVKTRFYSGATIGTPAV